MTDDPIARNALAAARRLAETHGAALEPQVEAVLYASAGGQRPAQYADPIAVASLIVSAATLAWTVLEDIRQRGQRPTRESVAEEVKKEKLGGADLPANEDIAVVVDETFKGIEE